MRLMFNAVEMELVFTYLAVVAAGTIGVAARMAMSRAVASWIGDEFPFGTVMVNVLGCFIIGLFAGLCGPQGVWHLSQRTQQAVTIGVLGGFTTFSSFSLQTILLMEDRQFFAAAMNVIASVVLCLFACWMGLMIARAIAAR